MYTAIILAGGLGTRLRGVIGDVPKCMAPVNGRPFLDYLIAYLEREHCSRLVLSLGYRHEVVKDYISTRGFYFPVDTVIEQEPLGTGGGILRALRKTPPGPVCVLNGDTMFDIPLPELLHAHQQYDAECTLALKEMTDFERYGTVVQTESGQITGFQEKQPCKRGKINGGVYMLNRERFLDHPWAQKFSFEQDYLEPFVSRGGIYGKAFKDYFIDIGVPEDYEQAAEDFQTFGW